MMKKTFFHKSIKIKFNEPTDYCILITAGFVFLYMLFQSSMQFYYEKWLIIPCMLLLGALQDRKRDGIDWKRFILPGVMIAWFLFLQLKRDIEHTEPDNIGLFLSVYLFAFPMASLLQDSDRKKALKIYAGAYTAAAAVLSVYGVFLAIDCLPEFLVGKVFWNCGRAEILWHPNVVACFLMIGILFCTAFLTEGKSLWPKAVLSVFLLSMTAMLALTNCRIVIILTGGYFGAMMFFRLIRHGKKWFLPGILIAVVFAAAFQGGSELLYQANYDRLMSVYSQQFDEQMTSEFSEDHYREQIPVEIDPDTGELCWVTDSEMDSLCNDFGELNARTYIWSAVKFAIRETPSILYWGMKDPGWYVSFYNFFPISHLHNAWLECLVGMGVVGFLMAMAFTVLAAWNALIVLLKHNQDIWKRNIAFLVLFLLVVSVMESYLFYTTSDYHMMNFLFFLSSGYLVHWQEADNHCMISWIRNRFSVSK